MAEYPFEPFRIKVVEPIGGHAVHLDMKRLLPRRVFTQRHIDYAADAIIDIYRKRDESTGLKIVWQPPVMRYFTARLAPID